MSGIKFKKSVVLRERIDVLKIQKGVEHTGNENLYRSLLEDFLKLYKHCEMNFEQLLEAKRYEELRWLFVDLYGLTGMLGAIELHRLLAHLRPILEQESSKLDEYRMECREVYQRFRREARRYLMS